jgi:hypothetical protein
MWDRRWRPAGELAMGRFRKGVLPAQAAARWHLPISLQAGWCSCNTAVSLTGSDWQRRRRPRRGLPVLQLELEVAAEMSPWYENEAGGETRRLEWRVLARLEGAARRPRRRPAVPSGCYI